MAQFARPSSDITVASWTTTPLWSWVDETPFGDGDWITSPAVSSGSVGTIELGLSSVTDPISDASHVLRVRAKRSNSNRTMSLTWAMKSGTTTLAIGTLTSALTTSFAEYSVTLPVDNAALIHTYSDLRVLIGGSASAGVTGTTSVQVSWIEFEVPDVASVPASGITDLHTGGTSYMAGSGASVPANAVHKLLEAEYAPVNVFHRGVNNGVIGQHTGTYGGIVSGYTAWWWVRNFQRDNVTPHRSLPQGTGTALVVDQYGKNDMNLSTGFSVDAMADEYSVKINVSRTAAQWEAESDAAVSRGTGWNAISNTAYGSGTGFAGTATAVRPTGDLVFTSPTIALSAIGNAAGDLFIRFVGFTSNNPSGGQYEIYVDGTTAGHLHGTFDGRGRTITNGTTGTALQHRKVYRVPGFFNGSSRTCTVRMTSITAGAAQIAGVDAFTMETVDSPQVAILHEPRLPTGGYAAHGSGTAKYGDSDVDAWNALLDAIPAQFMDGAVTVVELPLMHGNASYFHADLLHPNDTGHQYEADQTIDALTPPTIVAVGQALETNSAQTISRAKAKAFAQATSTETAQTIGEAKGRQIAQVSTTDTAGTVTGSKLRVLGQPSESDLAVSMFRGKGLAFTQTTETDTAQPIGEAKARLVAQTTETDQALATTANRRKAFAQAVETDTAGQIEMPPVTNVPVEQAAEVNTAQPVAKGKVRMVAQTFTTDTALNIAAVRYIPVAQTSETSLVFSIDRRKLRQLTQATETDQALSITIPLPITGLVESAGAVPVLLVEARPRWIS